MARPYRIVLADDHTMLREGVKRIIQQSEEGEGMEVVGEAESGLKLLELLKETIPDLVILDISMPGLRGIEATREIKSRYPQVKILMLTMHSNPEYLQQALSARVDGYLLKEDTDTELFSAIETVRREGVYLSPMLSSKVKEGLMTLFHNRGKTPDDLLTRREKEVLNLLADGRSSKEIGELLYISVRTVEHHRSSINAKLNIDNIVDLVKYAIRKGYTSSE